MSAGTILRETRDSHFVYPPRVFGLLVVYRWVSLIPPLVALILALTSGERTWGLPAALAVAGGINIFITLFYARLNRALLVRPWLLAIDIVIVVSLTTFTGGWRTPFLLYALNPLLAAAFFFRLPGALVAVTGFSAPVQRGGATGLPEQRRVARLADRGDGPGGLLPHNHYLWLRQPPGPGAARRPGRAGRGAS
jgi:hypothetical protein